MFEFPNPVNEVSARLVAAGVVVIGAAFVITQWSPLLVVLAYGFLARVLTGPRLSPLGLFVTKVVTPALGVERYVPGPPKRFAQGVGATLSLGAVIAWFAFSAPGVATVLVAMIVVAATLESVFAFCLGCQIFAVLIRIGVVPEAVCRECNDLGLRA